MQLCFTSPVQSFDTNFCHFSCLLYLSSRTKFPITLLNSTISSFFGIFCCTASCIATYYTNAMVASAHPMVKPQSVTDGHTHMFNAFTIGNEFGSPRNTRCGSQSPSSYHGIRHLTTPAPSVPSTPQEVGSDGNQGLQYDVLDRKS